VVLFHFTNFPKQTRGGFIPFGFGLPGESRYISVVSWCSPPIASIRFATVSSMPFRSVNSSLGCRFSFSAVSSRIVAI
jgi:hypothetical protein